MKPVMTLSALLLSVCSLNTLAAEPSFPHLSTSGYGEIEVTPDMAEFTVRIVKTELDAEKAKKRVDAIVDNFIAGLTAKGVKKESFTSSNLYISPEYQYPERGKQELVGYQASRTMTVKVEQLDRLNLYLDLALASGINQVDNIQLKVRDQGQYQQAARLAAIKDAQTKAASLAQGFGYDLGQVWRIVYRQPSNQPVLMRSMAMDSNVESASYQDSLIKIHDRVEVIYQIEQP
ncbi:oxidative stress defense protein [Vibrio hippocampi]|nr:oxidative stress defense protein [Vibrio hippocampi]